MRQNGLLAQAQAAVEQVEWLPEWGRARIDAMLANRPDWCISRQRTWGVPITLFVHKLSGELHPQTLALMEQVAQRMEQRGIDAWFELDAAELLGDEAPHYDKVTDTLDVWFDSGVTHACVLRRREGLQAPADLYLEGSDQHRGWFQSSLLTGIGSYGEAPYRAVLTHGFTVDSDGRKMSKSIGNVIAPNAVMNDLGADILRLWVAATDYRGELVVSDEIFKRTADSYRRIRNTARFLLSNLDGFDPATDLLACDDMLSLDRWALDRAATLQLELAQAYDSYQFHHPRRQRSPPLRPDRHVPHWRSPGALGRTHPQLYRRGNMGEPAGRTRRVGVPGAVVPGAAGNGRGRCHGARLLAPAHRGARGGEQGNGGAPWRR
jgi:isoleucyl-tRNA synthetase